jgi:alpha-ketoglutarate-dependent taurine dioxygenase
VNRLTDTVGAEVVGVDHDRLASDDSLAPAILETLEASGVLVFPDLHLGPEEQVAFCGRLGAVDESVSHAGIPGAYLVTLDTAKNPSAAYLRGTFHWHIDGCTPNNDEYPQMATVLSARAVAESGGETEFASTYSAYDDLTEDEKVQLAPLRVAHSLEASRRRVTPDPTEQQIAGWRSRPTHEHPLVWTHRSGRKSLVLGASADHVVGMDLDEGRALLEDLLARSTTPDRVYRHRWTAGDTVIWDNRGVLHRVEPYAMDSPREMLRTTVLGDEPIQ